MVFSSQDFQSAMHVCLHRPDGLAKRLGGLGVRQLMNVTKHDRFAIPWWQAGHSGSQRVDFGPPDDIRLRARPAVGLIAVQLDEPRPYTTHAVAAVVDRNLVQPRLLLQLPDA